MKVLKYTKRNIVLVVLLVITLMMLIEPIRSEFFAIISILAEMDIEGVKTYILSFGVLAPAISFLLMVFQSLIAPLPAFLITFTNASLFGWIKGAILSWSSAMVGAILCFYTSKLFGRQIVEKITSKYALDSMDDFFEKYGKYTVLIARLLPFVSFDIVSYASGLTSMSIGSFVLATGLGQLPATLIYSYVGEMLTGGLKHLVFGMMILMSLSLTIWVVKKMLQEKSTCSDKSEIVEI